MSREISTIAVVGLGPVGTSLAVAAARAGVSVIAIELDETAEATARTRVESALASAENAAAVTFAAGVDAVSDAQLVIEAVAEKLPAKTDVLAAIDKSASESAIIATTATAIPVSDLALGTSDPSRVVGLQPSLPVAGSTLVEVVRTPLVADEAISATVGFVDSLGKSAATVGDRPGQIVARLLYGYLNHAVSMFEQRYASREDLDAAMRFGCGYPVGPLAYLDEVGLDTAYNVLDGLFEATGERLHAPAPILKQMIAAGHLGKKSGKGFYTYAEAGSDEVVADSLTPAAVGDGAAAPRPVQSVGVVGSGTMASGIVEVFVKAGFDVIVGARSEEKCELVRSRVEKSFARAVAKGRMSQEDADTALGRISGVTDVSGLDQVDLVVEAVVEELSVKLDLFEKLDKHCKPGAILATTTSSLPVVEMAAVTSRPQDVIGLHFFNPAPIMKLVEIVVPITTGADVVATAHDLCARTKKVAVECGDRAGFIVNALLFPYLNDAVRLLEAGYASMDEIDAAIRAATGYPMGPFALLDVVGNDVSLAIQQTLLREFRDPGLAPAVTLEHLVAAGYQGRKTGRGFRAY